MMGKLAFVSTATAQIAKTVRSKSIRYQSYTKVLDRYFIDIDLMVCYLGEQSMCANGSVDYKHDVEFSYLHITPSYHHHNAKLNM